MANIFISYKQEQREWVARLVEALEKYDLTVWWNPKIDVGEGYFKVINKVIAEVDCVLVVWSHDSINSSWIISEAKIGMERNNLIPILRDDVMPPLPFNIFQNANLVDWDGDEEDKVFLELVSAIRRYCIVKGKNMSNFKKPTMVRIQNSLSIDMIKIPNKNYEIGKYPVTIAEYMHFAKNNEKHLPEWKQEKLDNYEKMNLTDNAPIIGISWHDALAYCKWLNEQQKVYIYRLPREEEWEYACRAGTTTKWNFGDDKKELDKYVWYSNNSNNKTHLVGQKLPNKWGFYDMYGLVWEWCKDENIKNRKGIIVKSKVIKGGNFNTSFFLSDSSVTKSWFPDSKVQHGFRLLRTLP